MSKALDEKRRYRQREGSPNSWAVNLSFCNHHQLGSSTTQKKGRIEKGGNKTALCCARKYKNEIKARVRKILFFGVVITEPEKNYIYIIYVCDKWYGTLCAFWMEIWKDFCGNAIVSEPSCVISLVFWKCTFWMSRLWFFEYFRFADNVRVFICAKIYFRRRLISYEGWMYRKKGGKRIVDFQLVFSRFH